MVCAMLLGGCPTSDEETNAASTTQAVPPSCEPSNHGEADPEMELCREYYDVLACCVPSAFGVGSEPWNACKSSFHYVGQGDAPPAPPECVDLMTTIIECAIAKGGEACSSFEDFLTGIDSGTTSDGVGPPTDSTMPCYREVVAAWDAGCQPYLY